jgi:hypothetical protein
MVACRSLKRPLAVLAFSKPKKITWCIHRETALPIKKIKNKKKKKFFRIFSFSFSLCGTERRKREREKMAGYARPA